MSNTYADLPPGRQHIAQALSAVSKADVALGRYAEHGRDEDLQDARQEAERLVQSLRKESQDSRWRTYQMRTRKFMLGVA